MFRIIWSISLWLVLLTIASILYQQISDDIFSNKSLDGSKKGTRRRSSRESTIYSFLSPYMSLMSFIFTLLLYGLFHQLYLEEFYDFLENYKNLNFGKTILFFLSVAASASLITKAFMQKMTVEQNHIKISRAKSVIVACLSFIFFIILYSFIDQVRESKFNLVKGFSISFTLGVLFYIIFGEILKFPTKWFKKIIDSITNK